MWAGAGGCGRVKRRRKSVRLLREAPLWGRQGAPPGVGLLASAISSRCVRLISIIYFIIIVNLFILEILTGN